MFRARTAQNVLILVGLQWFNRILGVVTKVILARLLFPDDFGVFALATGLVGFIATFGNFGLDYAIIQKGDKATEEDYDVGMSLRIVISVGLFIATVLVAGPWASLFQRTLVTPTTQFLALIYLVIPWSFVPGTRLSAELRYSAIAVPDALSQVVNSVLSIGMAFFGYGVWSLIVPMVVAQVGSVVAYSALRRWRFRLSFRRETSRALLGYARHLVMASVLGFLITNIDNFAVGYFLGSAALGVYTVAYGLGYLPVSLVSSPAGSALFPSLTKVQERPEALKRGYLESFGYAMAVIAPASVGIAVMSPEIVHILGPKWEAATLPLVALAFYGMARAIIDFSSSMFAAVGQPRTIAELNLYILIGSVVLLFPLTLLYGIAGTAVAMTIPVGAVSLVSIHRSAQSLNARSQEFWSKAVGPIFAAEAMGVLVYGVRVWLYYLLPDRIPIPLIGHSLNEATVVLVAAVAMGMLVYFGVLWVMDRPVFDGILKHFLLAMRVRNT